MKWEVRTMRSGTSFFNGTVFKKTLTRFWVLWAVNLVFWAILLPLQALLRLGTRDNWALLEFAHTTVPTLTGRFMGIVFAVLGGILAAMAVCSHLYNTRSANFIGSLPVRREGLFLSHYLAGLVMLLAPNCLVFLLTLAIEAAGGALAVAPLAYWLAVSCGLYFFFYSFAVCVGMFTGHIIALPAFYAIGNFLCGGIYLLLNWMMERFYYGFAGFGVLEQIAVWLTPVVQMARSIDATGLYYELDGPDGAQLAYAFQTQGGGVLAAYAIAGLVLAVCALLLYRCRSLESAGDVVAFRVMRPVFRYGVAFCGGISLGLVISSLLNMGEGGMMASIILWGVVGAFAAQMLLDKTFRVFRKWKGAAAVALIFAAAFLVIGLDLTGYETRVPAADSVASVTITGLELPPYDDGTWVRDLTLTDGEDIGRVTALHRAIIERGAADDNGSEVYSLRLTYKLKNGGAVVRYYQSVWISQEGEHTPGSVTALTLELNSSPAVAADRYDELLTVADSPDYTLTYVDLWDGAVDAAKARPLWAAVAEDMAAGRIGVHAPNWSIDTEYENRVTFTWMMRANGDDPQRSYACTIAVGDRATRTRAVLEELGRDIDPEFDVDAYLRNEIGWPGWMTDNEV